MDWQMTKIISNIHHVIGKIEMIETLTMQR